MVQLQESKNQEIREKCFLDLGGDGSRKPLIDSATIEVTLGEGWEKILHIGPDAMAKAKTAIENVAHHKFWNTEWEEHIVGYQASKNKSSTGRPILMVLKPEEAAGCDR